MKTLIKAILYLIGGWFFTVPTIIIGAIHLIIAFTKMICKIIAIPFKMAYHVIKEIKK